VSALFRDILQIEAVTTSLSASTKEGAISEISRLLAKSIGIESDPIRRVLSERERLASTGVGSGVAIPHGRLSTIPSLRVALAVHRSGLHFDAIDGQPVHIFVGIVGPDSDPGAHLRLLARASRILREEAAREQIIAAPDEAALRDVFISFDGD